MSAQENWFSTRHQLVHLADHTHFLPLEAPKLVAEYVLWEPDVLDHQRSRRVKANGAGYRRTWCS
jgi:hypothetical protein